MVQSPPTLPHWDMTGVYPGIGSPEFAVGVDELADAVADLEGLAARVCVAERHGQPIDDEAVDAFDALTGAINETSERLETITSFVHGYTAVDSRHEAAQARASELRRIWSRCSKVRTRYTAWVGSLDIEALIAWSVVAREHEYAVRQARIEATHLMGQSEEDLAAELTTLRWLGVGQAPRRPVVAAHGTGGEGTGKRCRIADE